ncbi:MAG: hypothetical protein KAW40_02535 [Candidatus Aenigmarchaeota archaeon]|nr:hypothetical protein [Candidatus Aenigmarchaeota archaeon]
MVDGEKTEDEKIKKQVLAQIGNYVVTRHYDDKGWEMFDVFFEQNLTSVSLTPEAFAIVKELFEKLINKKERPK